MDGGRARIVIADLGPRLR